MSKVLELKPLIFGVDRHKKSEYTDMQTLYDCDGLIIHSKIVRKDWGLYDPSQVCDPIRKRTLSQLAKCSPSCPEYGNDEEQGSGGGWT